MTDNTKASILELTRKQRSHNLYIFCNIANHSDAEFLNWYKNEHLKTVSTLDQVLSAQHFEQQQFDITNGISKPSNYHYLGAYELSLDGAEQAESLIDRIFSMYKVQTKVSNPAAWLYYPVTEKVGRSPEGKNCFMSLAFANSVKGSEAIFREWYSTQHIRHALNVPTIVSAQRFELTRFQKSGANPVAYDSLAVYQQDGSIEEMEKHMPTFDWSLVPPNPSLDINRFSEWVYYPITEHIANE